MGPAEPGIARLHYVVPYGDAILLAHSLALSDPGVLGRGQRRFGEGA